MVDDALKERIIAEIREYLKENLPHFEAESAIVWDKIDEWRAPLSHISPSLDSAITDKVEEWLWDNFTTEDFLC